METIRKSLGLTEREFENLHIRLNALNNASRIITENDSKTSKWPNFTSTDFKKQLKPGMVIVREGDFPPVLGSPSGSDNRTIGHAAIVSSDINSIIEAVDYGNGGKGEVKKSTYESFFSEKGNYFWIWPYYHAHTPILKPNSVEDKFGIAATKFAEAQIGLPYNSNYMNKYDMTAYYCSALCWRAWYEQGFEIGVTIGSVTLPYVSPNDLINGTYSFVVNNWQKK